MTMDKKWIIGTGKVVGFAMLATGAVTLTQEIAVATFAAHPMAQLAVMFLGFAAAYLKKPAPEVRK